MALDSEDEILQDFLVEADEILESLNEQLVALETQPQNSDLLNAIFRGFHTIKGGAGFLSLDAMVALCHKGEDVFNILRQGDRIVDAEMMDTFLKVLDILNAMFTQTKSGEYPSPADPAILHHLATYLAPTPPAATVVIPEPAVIATAAVPSQQAADDNGDITDEEFEALLNQLHGDKAPGTVANSPLATPVIPSNSDDDITEEEFEALLDELHGDKAPGKVAIRPAPTPVTSSNNADDITEEEFEALLDELHGDKAPGKVAIRPAPTPVTSSNNADDITEEEFEALLDELQGKKKTSATPVQEPKIVQAAPPAPEEKKAPPQPVASTASANVDTTAKPAAATKQAETSVRVDTARLDDIMNMVGELVLVRNRISTLEATFENEEMAKAVNNLAVVTADLQNAVMKTRMQPIKKVFGRFPRVVRDLARSLKKDIQLELRGEETDLDKNLVEALADPLVHLVRNAVDHGVEMPDIREKAGKSRQGLIILAAAQEGDHILLTISDDGAGMDANVLRQKAVEKGIMDEESASRLTDSECYALIFAPGFSMKAEISDISGRGVGMDVVKTSISKLNGVIDIKSEVGVGTTLSIKVPLTLAIMPTLMVMLGDQIFAFPLVSVHEIFHLDLTKTHVVDGQKTIMVRKKTLPLFYLRKWLASAFSPSDQPEIEHVVIVNVGTQRIGFVVDQLIGQEEVVIKPLGALLQGTKGLAGATITGDGRIALILDFPELMNTYANRGY